MQFRRGILLALMLCGLNGCLSRAPISTTKASISLWRAPLVTPASEKRVAIARPAGPDEVAGQLEAAIIGRASERYPQLDLIPAVELAAANPIRQVSAGEPLDSDLESVLAARNAGCALLLYGEILPDPGLTRQRRLAQQRNSGDPPRPPTLDQLRIAWRVIDVEKNVTLGRMARRHEKSTELPPSWLDVIAAAAPTEKLPCDPQVIDEAAEGALSLVAPFVATEEIELAQPWLGRGATRVRRGNQAAAHGDWPSAEREWRAAWEVNNRQHAAAHNLAFAALARQDYPAARRWAREATRLAGKDLYERSAVWVEAQWRAAHAALAVPPPAGGWYFAPP